MPRGGKRKNAGRPKGSKTKRTRAAISAVVDTDGTTLTPAAVMQKAMEVHYRARRYDKAAAIARDLAPYVHSRLSAVTHRGDEQAPIRLVERLVIVDGSRDADARTPSAS